MYNTNYSIYIIHCFINFIDQLNPRLNVKKMHVQVLSCMHVHVYLNPCMHVNPHECCIKKLLKWLLRLLYWQTKTGNVSNVHWKRK